MTPAPHRAGRPPGSIASTQTKPPQPQRIVMIEHSLQRRNQMILLHTRRRAQQHRLMEALDRPVTLNQPAHDRRRRQGAYGDVGQPDAVSATAGQMQPKPPQSDAGTPHAA